MILFPPAHHLLVHLRVIDQEVAEVLRIGLEGLRRLSIKEYANAYAGVSRCGPASFSEGPLAS